MPQLEFTEAFANVPDNVLRFFLDYFDRLFGETTGDAATAPRCLPHRETMLLDELWCRTAAGLDPGQDLGAWLAALPRGGGAAATSYDVPYLLAHWPRYRAAALRTRRLAGTMHLALNAVFEHDHLPLAFRIPLVFGGLEGFVSITATPRTEFALLFHQIAAVFDTGRSRRVISDEVYDRPTPHMGILPGPTPSHAGQVAWELARAIASFNNVHIRELAICFDLEWSPISHETRFTRGHIVDAHFEDVNTGWVIFTGLIRVPRHSQLSAFLAARSYTRGELDRRGHPIEELRNALRRVGDVCDDALFVAFNGVNADCLVLENAGVQLPSYLDACVVLTAGRLVSLASLYQDEFGEGFVGHMAATDTLALLRLLKHRGVGNAALWRVYRALCEIGACRPNQLGM